MSHRPVAVLLAVLLVALSGCGGGSAPSDSRPDQPATLILDAPPGAVHAGIYLALQRGYDQAEGVQLQVRPPASPSEGLQAVTGGQAELTIMDVHDLALARERGRDVVAVMALVQTPLAAVIARPSIRRAADLRGHAVGVTGRPGDVAVARVIAGGSVRPARVRFGAVRALQRGRVDGAFGLWTEAGVALKGFRQFRIDALNPPPYPELVVVTSRETLSTKGPVVRAAIRALRRGYEATINDPAAAVSALTDAAPAQQRNLAAAQLDAVSPSFTAGVTQFGALDARRLAQWARWEQRVGIVKRVPDVAGAFDVATSRTGLASDPNG
jgi:ABC-type nitrate/sulfonate/bicarbonate transport system substrate-binding protein